MEIFVTQNENGDFSAASVKNPIACMEIIEKDERLSSTMDDNKTGPEDMIIFKDFLTSLESRGVAKVLTVQDY